MHKDHRKHIKERFLTEGLDGFEPHEILELLLYYAIPQKNTNDLAHALINRFGSLAAVFDAPYDDLLSVSGISEHSATLIKLIPSISRRYALEKNSAATRLETIEDVGKYLVARYLGVTEETVLLLLLDNNHRLMECIRVHEGSVNSSSITMRRLVELALFKRASFAVLAHNHPDGIAIPSSDDIFTTRQAKRAFDLLEIHIMGNIIVAGDTFTNILDVHS